jgi:hypothetical protein
LRGVRRGGSWENALLDEEEAEGLEFEVEPVAERWGEVEFEFVYCTDVSGVYV